MDNVNIQIFLEIVIILIGLYMAFFKSYFKEKGKNLATKEDIKSITTEIETVKNQIHYYTQTKLSLKTEERNALVESTEKYYFWLNSITDVYFSGIREDSIEPIIRIDNKLDEANFNYNMSVGRLQLYIDDKELLDLHHELNIKTIVLHSIVSKALFDLKNLLIKTNDLNLTEPKTKDTYDQLTALSEQRNELAKNFNAVKLEKYKEIAPLRKIMRNKVYTHLQNITDNT